MVVGLVPGGWRGPAWGPQGASLGATGGQLGGRAGMSRHGLRTRWQRLDELWISGWSKEMNGTYELPKLVCTLA